MNEPESVLVVSGFENTEKIERHIGPLITSADEVTVVCRYVDPNLDEVRYLSVPRVGSKTLEVVGIWLVALVEAVRSEYDLVASFSLLPYGLIALTVKGLTRTPAHLGIIGIDLDVHAVAWYAPLTTLCFKRFDVVSVPGETYRQQLRELGLPATRIERLVNAVDTDVYRPDEDSDVEYDFVWAGQFYEVKAPLLFVEALAEVDEEVRAVMLGTGTQADEVRNALERHGLESAVDLPGWVEEPLEYYRASRAFVLTSSRDALPLTLVEAMATGLPAVAPPVGAVPEVVVDGENGLLVDRDPNAVAAGLEAVGELERNGQYDEWTARAREVGESHSYAVARADWRRVVETATR